MTEYREILNKELLRLEKLGFEIIPSREKVSQIHYLMEILHDTIKIHSVTAIRKNEDGSINAWKEYLEGSMHYIKERPIENWCIIPAKNIKYVFKHAKEMCSLEASERGRNLMNRLREQSGYPQK